MNLVVFPNRVHTHRQTFLTDYRHQFIDVTDIAVEQLERTQFGFGSLVVFSQHTTAGVIINEHEPLLLGDLRRCLDEFASPNRYYAHDDLTQRTVNLVENEPANGHSHCQQLAVGCSLTVPILDGKLGLGQWQRIFLLELDSPRERKVLFHYQELFRPE